MNGRTIITTAFLILLTSASAGVGQETPQDRLQAGIYAEEVQGNLEEAITIYRSILRDYPENRAVGAKAQLHIGLCLEILGLNEAREAYQRVVEDYGEHREEVALARERLASLTQEQAELRPQPRFRQVQIASKPQNGVLSPDGRRLAFISEGAVWVVPLHGQVDPDIAGEPVRLAEVPGVWDNGSLLAWSANGNWIAVNGGSEGEDVGGVSLIPAEGGETLLIQVPDRGGHAWNHRLGLSPDGQEVAISALDHGPGEVEYEMDARHIYAVPVGGAEPLQVSPARASMPSYSPDGRHLAYVGYSERDGWRENDRVMYVGNLWIVDAAGSTPIKLADVDGRLRGPVWSPDGRYIAAHYEPGGTNNSEEIWIYPLSTDRTSADEPTKIRLPLSSWNMVAGWTPDDELGVFMTSEEKSAIYTVPASGGKAVQITREGGYYPRWSPDGARIYFREWNGETEKVTTAYVPATGGDPAEIPVTPERWLYSRVPGGGQNVSPDGKWIVMSAAQEPYDPREGVDIWTLPLDGGNPTRITSDGSFEGYPCWSTDGEWIAFTDRHEKSEDEGFRSIYMVPAGGGEIREVTSETDGLSGGAIAFTPDGEGMTFFSGDAIKTIPLDGGTPEVLLSGIESSDHSQLAYSPDGSRIAHSVGGKIWITSLGGGRPQELRTGLPETAKLSGFDWSPDGQKIAFMATMGGEAEFWLISDFLPEER
ncbi:MAG: tetratricopeptide repeat protein [Gemmatimonadota bacterium]